MTDAGFEVGTSTVIRVEGVTVAVARVAVEEGTDVEDAEV